MKRITQIEPNVDLVEINGRKIYLVGTAHVSQSSVELVENIIRRYEPDTVCVELCESRAQAMKNPDRWQETDIFKVIRAGKAYVLLAQLVLSSFQKRIARQLGIQPGEEMRRAMETAEALGIAVAYSDREVRTTLKRAWAKAGFWSLTRLSCSLMLSLFVSEEVTEAEIEELKTGDMLSEMMAEFSGYLPGVKEVLIDERDKYLSAKVLEADGDTVVAVVGAGHIPGMKQNIGQTIDLYPLEEVPTRSWTLRAVAWGIPLVIIAMFICGFFFADTQTGVEMLSAWIVINGSLSALGALLALAHPLTIITAFVVAPITSLNPTIAAGWVCGLVEALLKKPRVKDFQTIADDITTLKGFWTNRVTKILLVTALANLGSIVGSFVGGAKLGSLLGIW